MSPQQLKLYEPRVHVDAQGGRTGVLIWAIWQTCIEAR